MFKFKIKKQYGLVSNVILKSDKLSASAKGLYVYLSARAGNKGTCNPSIVTICKDLNICKDSLYKYLNELKTNNIVTVTSNYMGSNTYHLAKVTKGYGVVLLNILTDSNLPLKAKALYGLMACLIGGNKFTYIFNNQIKTILNIGRATYFKLRKLLVTNNYIKIKQSLNKGKFSCNYFYFDNLPVLPTTTTPKIKFKKVTQADLPFNTSTSTSTVKTNIIKEQIEYEALLFKYSNNAKAVSLLDNIVEIIAGITSSTNVKSINVSGREVSGSIVKAILNKLTYTNVANAIDNVLKVDSKIKNLRNYLKVTLFNSYYN